MKTSYILDTSTLIHDPTAWKNFPNSTVIIPIVVLNELDTLKKQTGETGRNARVCIRFLDEISDSLDITKGIELEHKITLKIDAEYHDLKHPKYNGFGDPTYGDTQILACALYNWDHHPTHDVTLVSNDINLRVKAKARNINAISHEDRRNILEDMFSGCRVVINEAAGAILQQLGQLDPKDYELSDVFPNECVSFEDKHGGVIALGRLVSKNKIKLVKKQFPWNIAARNKEQTLAMDLIMDKNVDLVTLIGRSGGGKSLIAIASALELVLNKRDYDRLIIYRPIQEVGNPIGYLPGGEREKLEPWFRAIMDSFEVLLSNKNSSDWKKDLEMFQKKGRIDFEAIAYIRGRSIPNSILLIDESQNLNKDEIKTILTRAGENSKVILTGDIEQIDNSILDATNNGLTHVIEKFKDHDIAGHITFTQGERSRLATKAAEIL